MPLKTMRELGITTRDHRQAGTACWAVDDLGQWHDLCIDVPAFEEMPAEARLEFDRMAIFWSGMVIVALSPNRMLIRWSIDDVEDGSLEGVLKLLRVLPDSVVIDVEYFFGGWELRRAESSAHAVHMLAATLRLRSATPIVRPYVKQLPLVSLETSKPLLRSALKTWDESERQVNDSAWRPYCDQNLLFGIDDHTNDLVYRYLGRKAALIKVKGVEWAKSVVGKSCGRALEEISPKLVLNDAYADVIKRSEPRYDHVRACIPRADGEVEWVSYQRLLLPLVSEKIGSVLMCFSVITPDVSIPTPIQTVSNG